MKTRRVIKLLSIFLLLFSFASCQYQQNNKTRELQKEIKQLQDKLSKMSLDLFQENNDIKQLKFLLDYQLRQAKEQYKSIYLDVSEKGFGRIDSNLGSFLVSLDDVKPYANGYKLFLRIGNTQYARYSDIKLKVEWGKAIPPFPSGNDTDKINEWSKSYNKWEKSLRTKEITLNETLYPGTWNRVIIPLSPATKDDVGYIKLSDMQLDRVVMFLKKR
jgi:hypothetical protein